MTKKTKKIFKIVTGVIIFFTLPSLLFFGYVFFKYNEELPSGVKGKEADVLASNMLESLNFEAYQNTNYIEWTFKNRHHYEWKKNESICAVYWKEYKVNLDLKKPKESKVYVHNFKIEGENAQKIIETAIKHFNNDSFWLVAPYKIFDKGVERALVKDKHGNDALLTTFNSDAEALGDSYLWLFDKAGKPTGFKMWTSALPIDGLEASWRDWTTTESGALFPTFHNVFFMGLEIDHIKGTI
jgi:hypothetical protein